MSSNRAPLRIACVQHGDYLGAIRSLREAPGEPYFGMRASVAATEELLAHATESLIVSLDAPGGRTRHGTTEVVGAPALQLPGLLQQEMLAQFVVQQLRRFRPTHVLLRAHAQIGLRTARWCARHDVPTLAVLGAAVWDDRRLGRFINRRYMDALNHRCVARVYDWKPPACASMVEYGLDASKVFPYESGGARQPKDYPVKQRAEGERCRLVFAARMIADKGPEDVIDAVALLRARGIPAEAILFGDGPVLEQVRARAASLPAGVIATPGQVSNEVLFDAYRSCSFACVPTRPGFIEGMPMALTEALASRTPVIASDCKVFQTAFRDGEGVRLFRATDATHLADVVAALWHDPVAYQALSSSTAAAFARVDSGRTFVDVIAQWQAELLA